MEGYTAFGSNRTERCGGGVAVYIRNNCVTSCTRLLLDCPTDTESIFIQCSLPYYKILLGQLYRPPNTCPTLFIEQLSCVLDAITDSSSTTIIAGDFNFDLLNIHHDANVDAFFNMLSSYGFLPSIPLPTRQSDTRISLLDNIYIYIYIYIYCNNIASTATSGIIHDDLSDHFPIYLALNIETKKILTEWGSVTSFNYMRVEDLQVHLQNELHGFSHVSDPNIAYKNG